MVKWIYYLGAFLGKVILWIQGIKIHYLVKPSQTGKVIFAANHKGNIDPFVVAMVAHPRPIFFMAKKELFAPPIMSWLMPKLGTFPVDRQSKRDIGSIRESLKILQRGDALAMFPQGSRGGEEVLSGVAFIALKAKAPIVPIYFEKKQKWAVWVGEALAPEGTVPELTARFGEALAALEQQAQA